MFESSQVIDVNCLKTFNLKVVIYLVKVPQRTNHRCLTTELNNETCVSGSDNSTIYFVRGQGVYMIGGRGTPSSPSPAHSKTCCRFRVACSRSVRAIPLAFSRDRPWNRLCLTIQASAGLRKTKRDRLR